jgi:ketosteroid isomerase-like protein
MSNASVDLVRSIYADWERGDFTHTEWAHEQLELVLTGGGPADGSWKGLPATRQGWREFLRQWEDLRMEPDECRELDDQRVLVLDRPRGRGRASGRKTTLEGATLFDVRDGKVVKVVDYTDRGLALADLGLTPEGGSGEKRRRTRTRPR